MKNLFIFSSLLLLCACKSQIAAPDDENEFLQSEVAGSISVARETDNQLPMSERINLLFIASYYSQTNAIARFVEAGVPADSTNSAGMTTLMWATQGTRYAYAEVVGAANYLILHGAKAEAKDKNGNTAADYAFEYGRYNLLPILDVSGKYQSFYEGGAKRGVQDQLTQTIGDLVVESMSRGGDLPPEPAKLKIISDALKAGANPDQDIFLAALGGANSEDYWVPKGPIMLEGISELVQAGAKVNDRLSNGLQPLFYAVSKPALFKILLNAGADPHKASHVAWADFSDYKNGIKLKFVKEPIICEAAEFGVAQTLQMLLEHGVSIEESDTRGNTPLLRAMDCANVDAIDFLLKHHASLHATNNAGQNALDLAAARLNLNFLRTHDTTGRHHKVLEDNPGDPKSPAVGNWALESSRTNQFLRLDPQGSGEVFYDWKKTLTWKPADKSIEISVFIPQIPRGAGGGSQLGWVEYYSETDTCVLRWQDWPQNSAIKLVRVK